MRSEPAYRDHHAAGPSASSRTPPPPQPDTAPAGHGASRGTNGSAPGDGRGSMARGYRALVATYGDHYVLAVSRRASAHPERVDHQIEMSAPVEAWPPAHHADHAADQHRDAGRLYAGTDRPRAPGASGQLRDDRDQLVSLGPRFRPGRLRSPARAR